MRLYLWESDFFGLPLGSHGYPHPYIGFMFYNSEPYAGDTPGGIAGHKFWGSTPEAVITRIEAVHEALTKYRPDAAK